MKIQSVSIINNKLTIKKDKKAGVNEQRVFQVPVFGIANSGKLRQLFSYGLPCMYSGIEMIDPKKFQKLIKNKSFDLPIKDLLPLVEPFGKSLADIEKRAFEIIKERAQISPNKNIKEILQEIEPIYKKRLRKKQAPIFQDITEISQEFPEFYKYKFKQFMEETHLKLNDKPIYVPFSAFEFKYKLGKIRDEIKSNPNPKAIKVINKLIKEAEGLSSDTNSHTIDNQKKVISFLEIILRTSVLNNNEKLNNLINLSKKRLNNEKIKMPFNRKSFIYDLSNLIKDLPNKKLQEKMINLATTLPHSGNSLSAFITKCAAESSEKIGNKLFTPFMASVEHILPKFCGGADVMSNFGGATRRENTKRQYIDFTQQLKRVPQTRINCQKYVDRLIEYVRSGVFSKININIKYIEDFKKTIRIQSKGQLVLDTSNLYKKSSSPQTEGSSFETSC